MLSKKKKAILLRVFLRGYTRAALVIFGLFLIIGLWHPGFFAYGMNHLTTALADTLDINGLVLPPPETPTMTTELSCNPLNLAMALDLDWDLDSGNGTYTFDIYRNGSLMVAGLPSTTGHYLDTNLTIATPYTYKVRANGPMGPGFAESNEVTLTTPYNCDGLTPPTVEVTMFNGRPLASYRDQTLYNTHKRRPLLVGASNIPYAQVQIVIDTETRLVATVTANANGYWEWLPLARLSFERSTMYITATDPLNSERYAETTFRYQIVREAEGVGNEGGSDSLVSAPTNTGVSQGRGRGQSNDALFMSLTLQGEQNNYAQGEEVTTFLTPYHLTQSQSEKAHIVEYRLTDASGNAITNTKREVFLREGEPIGQSFEVPLYLQPGRYVISALIDIDGVRYTQSREIIVRSVPVLKLSNGKDVTYDEFMWNLGWIAFVALATVLLWLFLAFYEYWLFMHGKLYVDEFSFKKKGYLSRL